MMTVGSVQLLRITNSPSLRSFTRRSSLPSKLSWTEANTSEVNKPALSGSSISTTWALHDMKIAKLGNFTAMKITLRAWLVLSLARERVGLLGTFFFFSSWIPQCTFYVVRVPPRWLDMYGKVAPVLVRWGNVVPWTRVSITRDRQQIQTHHALSSHLEQHPSLSWLALWVSTDSLDLRGKTGHFLYDLSRVIISGPKVIISLAQVQEMLGLGTSSFEGLEGKWSTNGVRLSRNLDTFFAPSDVFHCIPVCVPTF